MTLTDPVLSIIIPTFNEAPNVLELVRQVSEAVDGLDAEIVFVDDSTDNTPEIITAVSVGASLPVRMIHRDDPVGGLSGAVQDGIRSSTATWCLVMDGDLQHPPSMVPVLLETAQASGADVVVASRYTRGGASSGLSNVVRQAVSSVSTTVTRAMFPVRLADCTDPMTGFFVVRRDAVDLSRLRPRGFKILLEILARHRLSVVEVPFVFGRRFAGRSKASLTQGVRFFAQLASLRFGRMSRFAVIGGIGAAVNIAIVAGLTRAGVGYMWAAIVAAELTIVMNFLLQERFVFRDLRHEGRGTWHRFAQSFGFNNVETAIRLPFLALLVSTGHLAAAPATAVTLLVAFVVRFTFHARVVYRPRASRRSRRAQADVLPALEERR
ncbi:glycosyltransferase [Cellulomonas sp. Leaf395]|uniref:glycosyltransferase n=1 Tax=Cellulomonas sp. Leaf395 TaxID=1736362 RepID=UPI0006FE18F3|nr:glycosyltransferase family 2 protein [Cellulomonas sp. Leaf395]KQT02342.1 glycosyl transferase family 2 [Cellulomonas sp. Leaf395]